MIFSVHVGFYGFQNSLHPAASGAFCNEAASNSTYLQHLGMHRYAVADVGWQIFFVPTRNHQLS